MEEKEKLNAVLSLYSSLRTEVLLWTRTELTAISILFSVDSLLFGYAITPDKQVLFLAIPLITILGTWLWLADHCMIRVLSAYISEEIEKKRIAELLGRTEDKSLWLEWDTFVQNLPKQLHERGAGRTVIIMLLLWVNTILPIAFSIVYLNDLFSRFKIIYFLCGCYIALCCFISWRIYRLSKRKYAALINENVRAISR